MKLTPTEAKILEDRLAMPDCLFDVVYSDELDIGYDDLIESTDRLVAGLPNLPDNVTSESDKFCLIDSVEGSTWIARMESCDEPQAKINRHIDAMQSLGKKVAQSCGVESVAMPWQHISFD